MNFIQHPLLLWDRGIVARGFSNQLAPLTPIFDNTSFGPGLQTTTVTFLSQMDWPQIRHFYPDCTISQAQHHFSPLSTHSQPWLTQFQLSVFLHRFKKDARGVPDLTFPFPGHTPYPHGISPIWDTEKGDLCWGTAVPSKVGKRLEKIVYFHS